MFQARCTGGRLFLILILSLLLSSVTATQRPAAKSHSLQGNDSTPSAIQTGSGYAFAESCQAELRRWSSASSSYGREYGHRSTSYYTGNMTVQSVRDGSKKVTSLITLCDGHPRVVGQVTSDSEETSTYQTTWTNINPTFVFASYPTPAPCSISPEDCGLLYSSWTSHYNEMTKTGFHGGLLDPPCTTKTSSFSYSTDANGHVCDNCQLVGSKIRLLYWPVVTELGSGNLCNKTAETISATPTGEGPNTFETLGITITSPSVAVSIGGLSRVDQCGTTVADTIIPVLPADVSSVEGARALFTHRPFNFANLNYKCLSDPDAIYFATSGRSDCYQEVPASVYFYGYANAAGADWYNPNAFTNSTIWPAYQPQVLPPNTLTEAIRNLWGPDCNIHPDGVWDPPIALGHRKSLSLPTAPGAPPEYVTPTSNPAYPALPTYAHPSVTSDGEMPASEAAPASKETASATSEGSDGAVVHVLHTTIFTLPANNEAQTMTAIYGPSSAVIVNAGSTLTLDNTFEPVVLPPFDDPGRRPNLYGQTLTVNGAEYIVSALGEGGFEISGPSTTLLVHQDARTTTSVGRLALATGAPSSGHHGDPSGHPSKDHDDSSTSSSGVRMALMTCAHLSLVAVLVAVFL